MALKLSKHCKKVFSYGICERCDECGYMTRREKYEKLKNSKKKLYNNSKKSVEQTENLLNDISNLDLACKEVLQILKEKSVNDEEIKKLSRKVKILSKIGKLLFSILKKFMGQVEKIHELSIENRIDF